MTWCSLDGGSLIRQADSDVITCSGGYLDEGWKENWSASRARVDGSSGDAYPEDEGNAVLSSRVTAMWRRG